VQSGSEIDTSDNCSKQSDRERTAKMLTDVPVSNETTPVDNHLLGKSDFRSSVVRLERPQMKRKVVLRQRSPEQKLQLFAVNAAKSSGVQIAYFRLQLINK
jgi:hypothetical protein